MSEQKNESDFKAKNMAEVTTGTRSACSGISVSAAEMVLNSGTKPRQR